MNSAQHAPWIHRHLKRLRHAAYNPSSRRLFVRESAAVNEFDAITRHDDAEPDEDLWVVAPPTFAPIAVVDADPSWPAVYVDLAQRIRDALGDRVLGLEHVGSTSVAGLAAKPVIDIDLTVADSSDDDAYVGPLEAIGYELRIREPKWHGHRCLMMDGPKSNLHVWSPGSPEAIRHRMFRDWLRDHPTDLARYADTKRQSALETNAAEEEVMSYNLRKQPVIREILDRMFRAHGMLDATDR
jgi:GrpB-like predicted nucleotidyltransferase (UPF0157 family)